MVTEEHYGVNSGIHLVWEFNSTPTIIGKCFGCQCPGVSVLHSLYIPNRDGTVLLLCLFKPKELNLAIILVVIFRVLESNGKYHTSF